ncbi:SDR family oxidoreductase [Halovulum dunhuangense]|uniref:SDR family oxidoreductase n=1 Tax=Halovulum dunhuangense TaxID=1505036 RepID=A0A849L5I8_9RHOB|nr:SDR family oxidoreductase [Halovulum dunhuangense]NNU81626.1 SDR family oxidoreductase [Halovulum dunhuangense]
MRDLTKLFSVAGKRALVTGGSSGIGRMIAEALAMGGADVAIVSRKADRCAAVADEINALGHPGRVTGFGGDVGSEAAILALAERVRAGGARLDILVNNAGISWGAPYESFPHAQWERVLAVNVAGAFTLTRELTPLLAAAASPGDPARIVNIGSVMGTVPVTEGAYSYTMSKAAMHHMTRVLAGELAARHITCNALAPGPFASRMTAFATGTEDGAARVGRNVPLGRIGQADDLAGAVLYLCSRAGAYVSGAILPLDGGMSAQAPIDLFANTLEP